MNSSCSCEVEVVNAQGMHARPVMKFVDLASQFESEVTVRNLSRRGEDLDGKSAMHLMLLDAAQGSRLRISARGADAAAAVKALAALVRDGFGMSEGA